MYCTYYFYEKFNQFNHHCALTNNMMFLSLQNN